jgi:hypothetical protein
MISALILAITATAGHAAAADAGQTCGLVTGLRGRVFLVDPEGGSVTEVRTLGMAVPCGQELLTSDGAAARVTGIKGNHFILGSATHATLVAAGHVDVSLGAVAVDQRAAFDIQITSASLSGETSGVAALWTSGEDSQWISLKGASRVWHPQLPAASVPVGESLFTETTRSSEYLDPRSAREPDAAVAKRFAASFGEAGLAFVETPRVATVTAAAPPHVASTRAPASAAKLKHEQGHQSVEAPVVAEVAATETAAPPAPAPRASSGGRGKERWSNKDFLDRLQARIQGEDYDEEAALAAKRQVKIDPATARRLAEAAQRKALVGKREDAFKAALNQGPDAVKGSRAIASTPERAPAAAVVETKAVAYPDELERENVHLIDKLIQSGGKARKP